MPTLNLYGVQKPIRASLSIDGGDPQNPSHQLRLHGEESVPVLEYQIAFRAQLLVAGDWGRHGLD